jgi:hypothetical protein
MLPEILRQPMLKDMNFFLAASWQTSIKWIPKSSFCIYYGKEMIEWTKNYNYD